MQLKKKKVGDFIDHFIDCRYTEEQVQSAKQLGELLRATYAQKGINYASFNGRNAATVANPDREIYEYQNFFLLETDGEWLLLDGFRRLLWYDAPDVPIRVRIYPREHLSDTDILNLLVYLNHFKFHTKGGAYHERGFGLLLRSIFGLEINRYKAAFNEYLTTNARKASDVKLGYTSRWSGGDTDGYGDMSSVKERITHPSFVSDMRFLQALPANEYMNNRFLGELVYVFRQETDAELDAARFKELHAQNPVLPALLAKYYTVGIASSEESRKVVNQIIEIYGNIFKEMMGLEVTKSYAEAMAECKALTESLKKDKSLTKLTALGYKKLDEAEKIMSRLIKAGRAGELQFKCVVYPRADGENSMRGRLSLPYGLREDIFFKEFFTRKHFGCEEEMEFGFVHERAYYRLMHNYATGYSHSYSKKYTKTEGFRQAEGDDKYGSSSYQYVIDVFVNIPQASLKK